MKRDTEELMEECIRKYKEIEDLLAFGWNDEKGNLLLRIITEEREKFENYRNLGREQENA